MNSQPVTTCIKHLAIRALSSSAARTKVFVTDRQVHEMANVSFTQPLPNIKKRNRHRHEHKLMHNFCFEA
jgi:hypothetical protein